MRLLPKEGIFPTLGTFGITVEKEDRHGILCTGRSACGNACTSKNVMLDVKHCSDWDSHCQVLFTTL